MPSDKNKRIQGRTQHNYIIEHAKEDEPKTQPLQQKRRIRTYTTESTFIMPSSTISLVTLGVKYRFDTVTIPNNVVMDYINGNQTIIDVSPLSES